MSVAKFLSVSWLRLIAFVSLACLASLASAEWIQVTGKAPLDHGRYDLAREQAMKDALRQAVYQYGVNVDSQQVVKNGIVQEDTLNLQSRAQVNQSLVSSEREEDGFLWVTLNVDMRHQALCESSQASHYKKKVAVLGFSVQVPSQTSLGGLQGLERGLSSQLSQRLKDRDALVVYEQSQVGIHADLQNAPTRYTEQLTLTHAADYAKQAGVQFVVSGVVRNLSVEDPESFSTSYWTRLKSLAGETNKNRQFIVDLFVHDGFSGAIVWQKQFSARGKWQSDLANKMRFDSPEFWSEDYGQQVAKVLNSMALNITEQLQCQPFMTRISRVDGKTLHFSAGASSGIRPGDTLGLYRTSNFYDANRLSGVELENVKTALTVSQVHPNFSSGMISVEPGRLNIQEDDLLIAW